MKTYYYGVKLEKTGIPVAFVQKKGVPENALWHSIIECDISTAYFLAKEKLKEYKFNKGANFSDIIDDVELKPGVVVRHIDDYGEHMAILLRKVKNKWHMLFFTSNSRWGYRRATKEELALAGYVCTKPTYLSFVTRDVVELVPTKLNFPEHRVADLIKENEERIY